MIKVFKQEIRDGLADIANDNSFVLTSKAYQLDDTEYIPNIDLSLDQLSIASEISNLTGLFPLKAILASVGKNKNDDIFTKEQLWLAKNSPVNKPFNFMHNQNDIIGHITGTYVLDGSGNVYNGDESPNDPYHIVSSALIYKEWIEEDKRKRINNIISEIQNSDKWFVSMECSFESFDYGLYGSDDQLQIVERNEATAYLTKYLKKYGGNGVYEDYQIGRVFKNINFIGKGLVDKPANPSSIILKTSDTSKADMENNEMPVTQEQFEAIQKELAAYKAKAEELQTKLSEETSKAKFDAYEGQLNEKTTTIKNLEASLASAKEDIGSVSAKLNEIVALYEAANTQLKDAESQNLQLSEKVKAFELERTVARRSSMLSDVGVDDVENTVAELSGLDDESFEKVIATIKKSKGKMYEDKTKMEEEEKKKKEMMKEKASEDILDDVDKTSSASVSDINTDNSGVATAAEQYFASILKTTQKANKK